MTHIVVHSDECSTLTADFDISNSLLGSKNLADIAHAHSSVSTLAYIDVSNLLPSLSGYGLLCDPLTDIQVLTDSPTCLLDKFLLDSRALCKLIISLASSKAELPLPLTQIDNNRPHFGYRFFARFRLIGEYGAYLLGLLFMSPLALSMDCQFRARSVHFQVNTLTRCMILVLCLLSARSCLAVARILLFYAFLEKPEICLERKYGHL